MIYTLEELAVFSEPPLRRHQGPRISGARPLEVRRRERHNATWLGRSFWRSWPRVPAGSVILPRDLDPGGRPDIRHDNPEAAFARLTQSILPAPRGAIRYLSRRPRSILKRIWTDVVSRPLYGHRERYHCWGPGHIRGPCRDRGGCGNR